MDEMMDIRRGWPKGRGKTAMRGRVDGGSGESRIGVAGEVIYK